MNWRAKALVQQVLSRVPGGGRLNYLMQTKVTRSLPASPDTFAEIQQSAETHLHAVCSLLDVSDPSTLRGYEFGAGWHLGVALGLAGLGVGSQTLVDREPLAHPELVRHSLEAMASLQPASERFREALRADEVPEALRALGITYLAPIDARKTALPPGSFDFVTSTSTLEHIPSNELDAVLLECFRLLRPGGAFSAAIDYGDHYAASDGSITRLNFLKFRPSVWRLYSPSLQFQSRLRHSDYVARVAAAGFDLTDVRTVPVREQDSHWVNPDTVDASFRAYTLEDLVIGDAHIVAVKPS